MSIPVTSSRDAMSWTCPSLIQRLRRQLMTQLTWLYLKKTSWPSSFQDFRSCFFEVSKTDVPFNSPSFNSTFNYVKYLIWFIVFVIQHNRLIKNVCNWLNQQDSPVMIILHVMNINTIWGLICCFLIFLFVCLFFSILHIAVFHSFSKSREYHAFMHKKTEMTLWINKLFQKWRQDHSGTNSK